MRGYVGLLVVFAEAISAHINPKIHTTITLRTVAMIPRRGEYAIGMMIMYEAILVDFTKNQEF